MKAALRGSYLEFVIFKGFNEPYPMWFAEEIYCNAFFEESQFTTWLSKEERSVDYHEKTLISNDSVCLRKSSGELFVTNMDLFTEHYTTFTFSNLTNSGIAAFDPDCIEYVECNGGIYSDEYPEWFYECYTEMVNFPHVETVFLHERPIKVAPCHGIGKRRYEEVSTGTPVTNHSVFLRNKFGEIKRMDYSIFVKYYDPFPKMEDNDFEY